MKVMTGRIAFRVVGTLLVLALGCRGEQGAGPPTVAADEPQAGGQVIVAIPQDISTLNEYQSAGEASEYAIIDLMFPSLMAEQPDYELHPPSFAPRLATSWEFSQDNRTLTFNLRSDARWSDGVPIT
ncbi:MAG: ABC transporter substrate-binding protein, partial [Acidobacteriota bacterium]